MAGFESYPSNVQVVTEREQPAGEIPVREEISMHDLLRAMGFKIIKHHRVDDPALLPSLFDLPGEGALLETLDEDSKSGPEVN